MGQYTIDRHNIPMLNLGFVSKEIADRTTFRDKCAWVYYNLETRKLRVYITKVDSEDSGLAGQLDEIYVGCYMEPTNPQQIADDIETAYVGVTGLGV